MYIVQRTSYIVHMLYFVQYTQCIFYNVLRTLYYVHKVILYYVQCTSYIILRILVVFYTTYNVRVHCKYNVRVHSTYNVRRTSYAVPYLLYVFEAGLIRDSI